MAMKNGLKIMMEKRARAHPRVVKITCIHGMTIQTVLSLDGTAFVTRVHGPMEGNISSYPLYQESTRDREMAIFNHNNCIIRLVMDPEYYFYYEE